MGRLEYDMTARERATEERDLDMEIRRALFGGGGAEISIYRGGRFWAEGERGG